MLKDDFKLLLSSSGERIFTCVCESVENNCDENTIATISNKMSCNWQLVGSGLFLLVVALLVISG